MSEKPRRRAYWIVGSLVVLLLFCGGILYLAWGLVQGIVGVFITPPNPTNEPEVIQTYPGSLPADLAFSPDGTKLAVLTPVWREIDAAAVTPNPPTDPPQLTVYDVTNQSKVFSATLTRWPRAVAFSPNGKHLAIGLGSSVTKVENDPKAELVIYSVPDFAETYRGRPGPACHPDRLEFSPDSKLLFAFRTDDLGGAQSVSVWQFPALTAGPDLKVVMTHPECATVTRDGTIIVGGRTKDYTAAGERFDRDGKPLGDLKYVAAPTGSILRFVSNDKSISAVSATGTQDFDPTTGLPVGSSSPHTPQSYFATHASTDGTRVGSVIHVSEGAMGPDFRPWYTKGGFLHVINRTTGKDRNWRTGRWLAPAPVAFSPVGQFVAAGFDDSAGGGQVGVKVWVSP